MELSISTKPVGELSTDEQEAMNEGRRRNWGGEAVKDWQREYPGGSEALLVEEAGTLAAFLVLRPVAIQYRGTRYDILGICSVVSLERGKGYGRVLIAALLGHLRRTGKTALGFTKETSFFTKTGLDVTPGLIKRFVHVDPATGERVPDEEGDAVYREGEDGFMGEVLSTSSVVEIPVPHW